MNGKIHSFLSILCLGILLCALGAFLVEILLCCFSGQLTFSMVRYIILQGIFAIIAIWYPYSFFVFLAVCGMFLVALFRKKLHARFLPAALGFACAVHLFLYLFVGRAGKTLPMVLLILAVYALPAGLLIVLRRKKKA